MGNPYGIKWEGLGGNVGSKWEEEGGVSLSSIPIQFLRNVFQKKVPREGERYTIGLSCILLPLQASGESLSQSSLLHKLSDPGITSEVFHKQIHSPFPSICEVALHRWYQWRFVPAFSNCKHIGFFFSMHNGVKGLILLLCGRNTSVYGKGEEADCQDAYFNLPRVAKKTCAGSVDIFISCSS